MKAIASRVPGALRRVLRLLLPAVTAPARRIAARVMDRSPGTVDRISQWTWLWQPGWSRSHHERFYEQGVDPYGFESAPEQAKYHQTLGLIGDTRYRRALEVGAGEGVFTAMLLPLCDELVASDVSDVALSRAAARLGAAPGLTLERRSFPLDLPDGTFDLVVVSDVAYFWAEETLELGLRRLYQRLRPGGRLLLLHYRGRFGAPVTADLVHDRGVSIAHELGLETRTDLDFEHRGPYDAGYRADLVIRAG